MEFKADINPIMSNLSYSVGDELTREFDGQKFRVKVVEISDGKVITEILEKIDEESSCDPKPLDRFMDNTLAYKLGKVVDKMDSGDFNKCGDEIDKGLVLRRLLDEAGFYLIVKKHSVVQHETEEAITLPLNITKRVPACIVGRTTPTFSLFDANLEKVE